MAFRKQRRLRIIEYNTLKFHTRARYFITVLGAVRNERRFKLTMQKLHEQVGKKFNAREGVTYEVNCACGRMFVTCNDAPLSEVFIRLGKAGGCAIALNESVGKLISHFLQIGGDVEVVLKSLAGVSCHQASSSVPSCVSAVAEIIREHVGQTKGKGE